MTSAAGGTLVKSDNRGSSSRSGLVTAALVFFAITVTLGSIVFSAHEELLAWDVRFAYLPAAEAALDGRSPYPELDDPILDDQKGYVYPPQLLLALVPLTPLPIDVAVVSVALGMLAMLGLTLWIVGVRDVRCYAATVLWVPSVSSVLFSNLSIPLALALAVLWRYRDDVWPPAVALGLSVSAKLLFWPMVLWTVVTGRLRLAVAAVVIGLAATTAAWAVIGFEGLTEYPELLSRLSEIQAERSYSIIGITAELGLGEGVGRLLMLAVGGALLVWGAVLGRRGDDVRSFTCAVAATLALSPIVWLHYLVALLVPLAIARPRFSMIWLLPVLLWISPKPGYAEGFATFVPGIASAILVGVLLTRPRIGNTVEAPA